MQRKQPKEKRITLVFSPGSSLRGRTPDTFQFQRISKDSRGRRAQGEDGKGLEGKMKRQWRGGGVKSEDEGTKGRVERKSYSTEGGRGIHILGENCMCVSFSLLHLSLRHK